MDVSNYNLNDLYDQSQNHITLNDSMTEDHTNILNIRKKELIEVVLRQTVYNEIEAETKLKEYNFDVIKVLNDYHGISLPNKEYPKTTNQQIYGEIRNLMDIGAKSYRIKQELIEAQENSNK